MKDRESKFWFTEGYVSIIEHVVTSNDYIGMAEYKNGTYEIIVLSRDLFEKKILALDKNTAKLILDNEIKRYNE